MKCLIETCNLYEDCEILEITGKQPKDKYHCSYYRTKAQAEKIQEQKNIIIDEKDKKLKLK